MIVQLFQVITDFPTTPTPNEKEGSYCKQLHIEMNNLCQVDEMESFLDLIMATIVISGIYLC